MRNAQGGARPRCWQSRIKKQLEATIGVVATLEILILRLFALGCTGYILYRIATRQ